MSETGKDLSVPGDTKCWICYQWIPDEDYHLHSAWHDSIPKPLATGPATHVSGVFNSQSHSLGIYQGMSVEDAVNQMAGILQILQQDKNMMQNTIMTLQNEILTLQKIIGTEGTYRFLRDWGQP